MVAQKRLANQFSRGADRQGSGNSVSFHQHVTPIYLDDELPAMVPGAGTYTKCLTQHSHHLGLTGGKVEA